MAFPIRKGDIFPWIVMAFVGAALGRNLCHHAGWPWWIGFTAIPAGLVLTVAGLQLILRKRARRRRNATRSPEPPEHHGTD